MATSWDRGHCSDQKACGDGRTTGFEGHIEHQNNESGLTDRSFAVLALLCIVPLVQGRFGPDSSGGAPPPPKICSLLFLNRLAHP